VRAGYCEREQRHGAGIDAAVGVPPGGFGEVDAQVRATVTGAQRGTDREAHGPERRNPPPSVEQSPPGGRSTS
jgi:hypothetical protein